MRDKLQTIRMVALKRKWRFRAVLWAAFGVLAWLHPYSPTEGRSYFFGLIILASLAGLVAPRPFLTTATGVYVATLVRMATLDADLYPYISIEMIAIPVFAVPTRLLSWAVVDRHLRKDLIAAAEAGLGLASNA